MVHFGDPEGSPFETKMKEMYAQDAMDLIQFDCDRNKQVKARVEELAWLFSNLDIEQGLNPVFKNRLGVNDLVNIREYLNGTVPKIVINFELSFSKAITSQRLGTTRETHPMDK